MLKIICHLFYTELILLIRRSQDWLHPLIFFIIVISLFPLAFTPDPIFLKKFLPSCLWISALLASLLSIENVFVADLEDGHIDQLLLSQLPLSLLIFIKLCAQWLVAELPLILLTPLLGFLFHLDFSTIFAICLSLIIGTPILTFIGSLGVALTLGLRQQGVLLGLLILPLTTPVLIFGVMIVQQVDAHLPIAAPLAFLAGISLFMMMILPAVIAATLRISLDD